VYYSSLLEKELTYDLQENYKICNTFLSNLKEGDFFDKKYLFPIYSQVQERFDACKRI
jgi:hypothetical protein